MIKITRDSMAIMTLIENVSNLKPSEFGIKLAEALREDHFVRGEVAINPEYQARLIEIMENHSPDNAAAFATIRQRLESKKDPLVIDPEFAQILTSDSFINDVTQTPAKFCIFLGAYLVVSSPDLQ